MLKVCWWLQGRLFQLWHYVRDQTEQIEKIGPPLHILFLFLFYFFIFIARKVPEMFAGSAFNVLKRSAKRARSVLWNASHTSSKCLLHIRKMCSRRLRNAPKLLETSSKVHEMSAKCAPNVRETCPKIMIEHLRNVLNTSTKCALNVGKTEPTELGKSAKVARNVR